MISKTWTREPIASAEGVGMVYRRGDYRIHRLGRDYGWLVWHGDDFLSPVQRLSDGKGLVQRHEVAAAWVLAWHEDRARDKSDWALRQALAGAQLKQDTERAAVYAAEIERRQTVQAQTAKRERTEYTMHAYRAPFSGTVFNHITPPANRRTLCRALYGGPGEPLDLAKVDCLGCLEAYAQATIPHFQEAAA